MIIDIDDSAGFCWGVVQTIDKVENALSEHKDKQVYVLGQIIHNPKESERLEESGLKTIEHKDFEQIDAENSVVIIRAHGEPPTTYSEAADKNISIIDATCPLVRGLQNSVKKFYKDGWQVVIFGKVNHSEVIGLRGVCNDECVVIKSEEEAFGKIDFSRKTVLFSQTTMDRPTFCKLSEKIKDKFAEIYSERAKDYFVTRNSICKFVSRREDKLISFAESHDFVIFVAGKNSSNGKILFDISKKANENTIFIEDVDEVDFESLAQYKSIGITGATSTPQWFMEHIKNLLSKKFNGIIGD